MIIKPSFSEDEAQETQKKLRDSLTAKNAEITKEEFWGKKKLAYPIAKEDSGYYLLFDFQMEAENARALEKELLHNNEIMRHLLVKIEKEFTESKEMFVAEETMEKSKVKARGVTVKGQKSAEAEPEEEIKTPEADKKKVQLSELDEKIDELLDKDIKI